MAFREIAPASAPDHGERAAPVLWFAAWALRARRAPSASFRSDRSCSAPPPFSEACSRRARPAVDGAPACPQAPAWCSSTSPICNGTALEPPAGTPRLRPDVTRAWTRSRGWSLPCFSSGGASYQRGLGEPPDSGRRCRGYAGGAPVIGGGGPGASTVAHHRPNAWRPTNVRVPSAMIQSRARNSPTTSDGVGCAPTPVPTN
jgi:hypothetical protein